MKKYLLTIATTAFGLTAALSTTPTFATVEIAFSLFGESAYTTSCNQCHTNANLVTADNKNLMPAAKLAYKQKRLAGLKEFVTAQTPKPVAPTCTGKMVLNSTKDACVTLPAPIITPTPTTDTTPVTSTENTKPALNKVAAQWDATVGETLEIPLSVQDTEQDEFKIIATKVGSKFSAVYTDEKTKLPTVDFLFTPTAKEVNKISTFTFQAKETKTPQKLISNKVSVRVRVWAAGDRDQASVKSLNVSTSALKSGKLNLSGAVEFSNLLTATERKKFIANKFDLTVLTSDGIVLATTPLKLDTKGNWSTALSVKNLPCEIVLEYQGQKASRSVVGCVAPAASITSTVVANNDFLNTRFDDEDEHENEHDDHDHDDHDD